MKLLLVAAFLFGGWAYAEDKTCAVKGMHCADCAMTVKEKVCNDKYSTCDVKVTSAKKELGSLHIVTKDKAQKIDETAIGTLIKDVGYSLDKCVAKKEKAS